MSDKEAEKRTQEEVETQKKSEEAKERMEIVQLMRDPVLGGQTVVVPVQNVDKQWQVDMMLEQAKTQADLTKFSRSVIMLLTNMGIIGKKKGLFKR